MSLGSPTVFFDTQAFRLQNVGGISRYFAEIIHRLPSFGVRPKLVMPLVNNEHAVTAGLSSKKGQDLLLAYPWLQGPIRRTLRYADRLQCKLGRFDVLHRTYYSELQPVKRPAVCTVVDMIPELFPNYFPRGNPHGRKREVVEASDLVLSISESTSRDIVQLYGIPTERVVTTPLGIDVAAFSSAPKLPNPFTPPYVLFLGRRDMYKNFRRFSAAAVGVLAARTDLSLAVVGGGRLGPEEIEVFLRAGLQHRVRQANVSDALLPTIYRGAAVFVFPSEYEGFGLPLLESFACDCPVAASRGGSLAEVGGDAAEYFDPTSTDDIAHAIARVIGSPARADELRRLGSERVKLFSWERTAALTAAAYSRLC